MRVIWVFTVPLGFFVLLLFGAPSMFRSNDEAPDPDKIINLFTELDYSRKADGLAARGDRQEAIDTCEAMLPKFSESDRDLCLLDVYKRLNDIDGQIAVNERRLERQLADGDSGALTKRVLDRLKEERDKQK